MALADAETVNFGGCDKLTDTGLMALTDKCHKCRGLKEANFRLWGDTMFTAETKAAVQQQYPNILFSF